MNRIERDKQRSRMKKQIDDIIRNNPEYARRHKEEQEENVMQALSSFPLRVPQNIPGRPQHI